MDLRTKAATEMHPAAKCFAGREQCHFKKWLRAMFAGEVTQQLGDLVSNNKNHFEVGALLRAQTVQFAHYPILTLPQVMA